MKEKQFTNFSYTLIQSSLDGYEEVLVTYEFKGKPYRKVIYIKKNNKFNNSDYIKEAKKKIGNYVSDGRLAKNARFPHGFSPLSIAIIATTSVAAVTMSGLFIWKAIEPSYSVIWKNYDGTILEVDSNVHNGDKPTFNGRTPIRNDIVYGDYTFNGWDKKITPIDGANQTYTATYDVAYNCDVYFKVNITKPNYQVILTASSGITNVDWGDGRSNDDEKTHTYRVTGQYDIKIKISDGGVELESAESGEGCIINGFFGSKVDNISSFADCHYLQSVEFAEGIKISKISEGVFQNCTNLTSIKIPDTVKQIGANAFLGCTLLEEVILTSKSQLNLIYSSAFQNCKKLSSISIPNDVRLIDSRVFEGCDKLERVDISKESNLSSIGESAFYSCQSLLSINIPNKVTKIDNGAFNFCAQLATVDLTSFVVEDEKAIPTLGYSAFDACSDDLTFYVANENMKRIFMNKDGWKEFDANKFVVGNPPSNI